MFCRLEELMGFVLKLCLRGFYVYVVRLDVVDHVTMLGSVGLGSD